MGPGFGPWVAQELRQGRIRFAAGALLREA